MTTNPLRMEAVALDAAGNILARCPIDPEGTGRLTFELEEDAPEIRAVRWTDADGVTRETDIPGPIPFGTRSGASGGPRGECPTCHRDLGLDADPDGSTYIPLHGGWPPCAGSGMPA